MFQRGHDARAVAFEFRGQPDAEVFSMAEGRVVVTANVIDFVALLEDRVAAGHDTAAVVFARKASLSQALVPCHRDSRHGWMTGLLVTRTRSHRLLALREVSRGRPGIAGSR